jgi:hypothetical protein
MATPSLEWRSFSYISTRSSGTGNSASFLLPLLLAGQLGVDLLPLGFDRPLQGNLLLGQGGCPGIEGGFQLAGRVEPLQHAQDLLLQSLPLPVETLHLEPHVLGLTATHPAGEQPCLVLGQLGLEDLQLALRFVELQLEGPEIGAGSLDLDGQSLLALVCVLVSGQLGE